MINATSETNRAGGGPAVELRGIEKAYGRAVALRGIDLRIERGEVVAILGPNGAGKTTAISLMLGLRRASAGDVRLFGLEPSDRRARSMRGAMLQEPGVPNVLSVRELVELFRSYYPTPLAREAAIELAGLGAQAETPVARLSGGQRQRLYFALAVCGDPDALFLDEPTTAMDVAGRRRFLVNVGELAARGKTIILTTHDMAEADVLARRIVVVDRGRIVADDTPAAIKARLPGRRVSFQTAEALDPGLLVGLPITGLTAQGPVTRFLTNEPESVLSALFGRGVHPRNLEVVGADLEEAFLALTGHQEMVQ